MTPELIAVALTGTGTVIVAIVAIWAVSIIVRIVSAIIPAALVVSTLSFIAILLGLAAQPELSNEVQMIVESWAQGQF